MGVIDRQVWMQVWMFDPFKVFLSVFVEIHFASNKGDTTKQWRHICVLRWGVCVCLHIYTCVCISVSLPINIYYDQRKSEKKRWNCDWIYSHTSGFESFCCDKGNFKLEIPHLGFLTARKPPGGNEQRQTHGVVSVHTFPS